jgi:hypothetical protein
MSEESQELKTNINFIIKQIELTVVEYSQLFCQNMQITQTQEWNAPLSVNIILISESGKAAHSLQTQNKMLAWHCQELKKQTTEILIKLNTSLTRTVVHSLLKPDHNLEF